MTVHCTKTPDAYELFHSDPSRWYTLNKHPVTTGGGAGFLSRLVEERVWMKEVMLTSLADASLLKGLFTQSKHCNFLLSLLRLPVRNTTAK